MGELVKPVNWKILGRFVYAYLVTLSTLALFYLLVNIMRAYIEMLDIVLKQPNEWFTNKVLFLLLLMAFFGALAIYWLAGLAVSLGGKAWELWKELFRPWRCQYGGRACEVGKKGVDHPRFFCKQHFMERLETRVAIRHLETKRVRA